MIHTLWTGRSGLEQCLISSFRIKAVLSSTMNEKPIIICQFWFKILKLARRNNIWVLVRLAGRYISNFAKYTEPMTIFGGSRLGSRSGSVATATTTRSIETGSTSSSRMGSRKTIKAEPEQTRDQKLMLEMICQVSFKNQTII